jgi:asparagine synthase (glutamine-hydrolysing)
MANGVEARVPFLDPDLVEYVYRLPLKYKLSGGTGKVILREALRGVVPAWVIERRKQGFGAPVVQWLASDLGPLFLKLLETEGVRRYFDAAALRSAMATSSQRSRFGIWPILNFALWHRYWIEQEPLDPLLVPLLATRQNRAVTDELGV